MISPDNATVNKNNSTPAATNGTNSTSTKSPTSHLNDDTDSLFGRECDEVIKVGDWIAYYAPIGVAGDPRHYREAEVKAVRPNDEFPLTLSTNDSLPSFLTVVKRIKTISDDELIDHEGGCFWPLDKYEFQEGGSDTAVADVIAQQAGQFSNIFNGIVARNAETLAKLGPTDMIRQLNGGQQRNATLQAGSDTAGKSDANSNSNVQAGGSKPSSDEQESADGGQKGSNDDPSESNVEASDDESNPKTKCTIKRCPKLYETRETCAGPGCDRLVHNACSRQLVLRKHKNKETGLPLEPVDGKAFCTKGCYTKFMKDNDTSLLGWNNDGKNGRSDPNHSERLLINWASTHPNYDNYRNGENGTRKTNICKGLASMLNDAGVRVERTAKQVQNKIEWIESKMRATILWSQQTGVGVLEEHGQQHYNQTLTNRFPYYHDLIDIFRERAGMVPKVTTDDIDWDAAYDGISEDEFRSDDLVAVEGGNDEVAGNGGSAVLVQSNNHQPGRGTSSTAGQAKRKSSAQSGSSNRAKAPKTSNQGTSPGKKGTGKPKKIGAVSDALGQLISMKLEMMKEKKESSSVSDDVTKKVALAKKFKEMVDALGGDRIMAAQVCPEFKLFLNKTELETLGVNENEDEDK